MQWVNVKVLNLDLLFSKQYHILAVIRIRLVLNKLKLKKTFFVCFIFRSNFAFLRFKWEKPFFWPRIGIFWTPVSNLLSYSGYIEVTVRLKSVFDVSPIFCYCRFVAQKSCQLMSHHVWNMEEEKELKVENYRQTILEDKGIGEIWERGQQGGSNNSVFYHFYVRQFMQFSHYWSHSLFFSFYFYFFLHPILPWRCH